MPKAKKSDAIVVKDSGALVAPEWMKEAAAEANEDAAKFQQGISRVNFSVSGPTVDGQLAKDGKLRVIIVAAVFGKAYYEKPYNPKEAQTPSCYAFDANDPTKMVPHEAAPDKQNAACTGCPHNVFGTALMGAGKRCKDEVRLMVASAAEDANGNPSGEYRMASIPPGSLKGWGNYVKTLRDLGAPYNAVITELGCEPLGGGFRVTFRHAGFVSQGHYEFMRARKASSQEEMMQPYPVLEAPAPAAPEPKGKARKAKF